MSPVLPPRAAGTDPLQSEATGAVSLPLFKQMTIVGVGLIGGSLGMVCKQYRLVSHVVGTGRRVHEEDAGEEHRPRGERDHDSQIGVRVLSRVWTKRYDGTG